MLVVAVEEFTSTLRFYLCWRRTYIYIIYIYSTPVFPVGDIVQTLPPAEEHLLYSTPNYLSLDYLCGGAIRSTLRSTRGGLLVYSTLFVW